MSFDILTDGYHLLKAPWDEVVQAMTEAVRHRIALFGRRLFCYGPTSYPYNIPSHSQGNPSNFVALSITGSKCSLGCEHCKGKLLTGMEPILTPEHMLKRLQQVRDVGGDGVLISGGSNSLGHVPLLPFGSVIRKAKQDLGLEVVVHTGLVDHATALMLAEAGVDATMLDVIGDATVAHEIYHIENGPQKIRNSLRILRDAGIPIVPHVMVGLYYGQVRGEIEALDMVSDFSPEAIVIIALNPLRNTPLANVQPPSPESIARILTIARLGMNKTPLLLGCARPLGEHKVKTDRFAVRSGVNGVAYISQEGVDIAWQLGLEPVFRDVCCSLAYRHVRASV